MTLPTRLQTFFDEHEIPLRTVAHPRTYTSRDSASTAQVRADHVAKGVLLKDAEGFLLAVIPADRWVRLGALGEITGRPLSLADEAEVPRVFAGCDPGAVPPLAAAFGLQAVVDEALTSLADVYLEAGDHSHLIHLTGEQFQELVRGARIGHFTHPG